MIAPIALPLVTFSAQDPGINFVPQSTVNSPGGVIKYFPVFITNNQTISTPVPFDQKVTIDSSNFISYESSNLQNVEWFESSGAIIPSWIENNGVSSSTSTTYWLRFEFSIPADSTVTIYLGFVSPSTNLFSLQGPQGTSPSINQNTDNGAVVFPAYYPGNSLNGWSESGVSGALNPAPSGSPSGSWAFYAQNSKGSYLYRVASAQSTNMIIEYYTYDVRLNDLFFLANSTGNGQYSRVGDANGTNYAWYGIGSTQSWTLWSVPQFAGHWQNEWLTVGVVVDNGRATEYMATGGLTYGSEIGSNPTNTVTVSDMGNYLGLVGDSGGSSNEYWNGIIIRPLPPNDVMPSVTLSAPPTSHPVLSSEPLIAYIESYMFPILAGVVAAILIMYARRRDDKRKQ